MTAIEVEVVTCWKDWNTVEMPTPSSMNAKIFISNIRSILFALEIKKIICCRNFIFCELPGENVMKRKGKELKFYTRIGYKGKRCLQLYFQCENILNSLMVILPILYFSLFLGHIGLLYMNAKIF